MIRTSYFKTLVIVALCITFYLPVFASDESIDMAEVERLFNEQLSTYNESSNQQTYEPQGTLLPAPVADDLFSAALNGNNQAIGQLLSQGLNVNSANNERETALHMAASRGHYSTVIYLINNGAYVNARTIKNWIPLHHAVRFNHPNIVNYLVKQGSSPSVRTTDGLSSIDMARNRNDYRLLSLLGAR